MKRNKNSFRQLILSLVVIIIMAGAAPVYSSDGGIVVNLRIAECPWADIELGNRLDYYLSAINDLPVVTNETILSKSGRDIKAPGLKELLALGATHNSDYVVDIAVNRIDLEKRKVTVMPQIIFRYRMYAVLSGSMRIIDIKERRLIKIEEIEYEIKAKDRWRFVDDDENDADLMVTVDKRTGLFRDLEDKAASELYLEIKKLAGGTGFDNQ